MPTRNVACNHHHVTPHLAGFLFDLAKCEKYEVEVGLRYVVAACCCCQHAVLIK